MLNLRPKLRLSLHPLLALPVIFGAVSTACAAEPPEPEGLDQFVQPEAPAVPAFVEIAPGLRELALPYDAALLERLRLRDWAGASKALAKVPVEGLVGGRKGMHAFVRAWALVHAGQGAEAAGLIPLLDDAPGLPADYRALVEGEVLLAQDKRIEALVSLAKVEPDSALYPRVMLRQAEALRELSRTKESWELVAKLTERPDPAPGNPEALLGLATHYGAGSPSAYPLLRRLWASYPNTKEGVSAEPMLAKYPAEAKYKPTWQEAVLRAASMHAGGRHTDALALLEPIADKLNDGSVEGCKGLVVRGRAAYKLNRLTDAVTYFGDVGKLCVGQGEDGARGLYLQATAETRRKRYAEATKLFEQLATDYATSSMADDGWTLAGNARRDAGDEAGARAYWLKAAELTPAGDTVPEALIGLAVSRYEAGDVKDALALAEAVAKLPLDGAHVEVHAGRYWAGRLLLYPDAKAPSTLTTDAKARAEGLKRLEALCREAPWSFYAILAYSRIVEVDPERAKALASMPRPTEAAINRAWQVRPELYEQPSVQRGVWLARVGLSQEARVEWADVDRDTLRGDEMAWLIELQINAGDWLAAHDTFRQWLKSHPLGTHGGGEAAIARVAYPDRWWKEVQASWKPGYRYEPRFFHSLSREESNFNPTIISHAGARGLSQLMPATAKETAVWLKLTNFSLSDLDDPQTNLNIGGRYLDQMFKQLDSDPYLSLAAYNAGAGRANRWTTEWGNPPVDQYIEHIPYRETNGYVKRVMGTWQIYRSFFDEGPVFPDLSKFNHHAQPKLVAP